jgi:hypothetical protein
MSNFGHVLAVEKNHRVGGRGVVGGAGRYDLGDGLPHFGVFGFGLLGEDGEREESKRRKRAALIRLCMGIKKLSPKR